MKAPGKTSLYRMQRAALNEAQRSEIGQDGRVRCGMQRAPMSSQVLLRDDFYGVARLIDAIMADADLLARVESRMRQMAAQMEAAAALAPGGAAADGEDDGEAAGDVAGGGEAVA